MKFQITWLKNNFKEKEAKRNGVIIKIPQKFDPHKYLKYFINKCKLKEEDKTKATTTALSADEKINIILNKKRNKMERRLEEYENNFYSIEYRPEVKIPNL